MNTINAALDHIKELDDLKEKQKYLYSKANEIFNNIKIEEFEMLPYEECNYIYDYVFSRVNEDLRDNLKKITRIKKENIYPDILKPHYYPELVSLNIGSKEKLEIDSFIRNHLRYILSQRVLKKCKPLSDNIEQLVRLGIVSKNYSFICSCGAQASVKSQEELNACFKMWELENKEQTTKDSLELEELYEKFGFGVINLCCFDCEKEAVEISNLAEFNEYLNDGFIEIYYKIIKNPDLTFEQK